MSTRRQRVGLQLIQSSHVSDGLDDEAGCCAAFLDDRHTPSGPSALDAGRFPGPEVRALVIMESGARATAPRLARRLISQTLVATTMLCPLFCLGIQAASAQTPVGPGTLVNYSAGGTGTAGTNGGNGNSTVGKNHNGGAGTSGGPGPANTIAAVNGTTISASSGIAAQVVATGGPGGAGGMGETPISGFTGNGGAGGAGGAAGSGQATLESGATVTSTTGQAVLLSADGGHGGDGGMSAGAGNGGQGGAGGAAGPVTFRSDIKSTIQTLGTPGSAVLLQADGGTPGVSQSTSYSATGGQHGPDGAAGGAGGAIQATFGGTITAADTAVFAQSSGVNAGDGGQASNSFGSAYGGDGGTGGNGGTVKLQFLPGSSTSVTTAATNNSLVTAGLGLSSGGAGGQGGAANVGYGGGYAGKGGASGAGGAVEVDAQGAAIATTGGTAAGLLAESIGGEGGSAGSANSIIHAKGGKGAAGGAGGNATVTLKPDATATTITTAGANAAALVAQSIGGGGGYGGNASGISIGLSVAIGGTGGTGGTGGGVTVSIPSADPGELAPVVLTTGLRSPAMLAQSIGGGGGNGGSVSAINFGVVNLTIGGTGGTGGVGGQAFELNYGTLQTDGDHSPGMEAQSVGGGGGNGGSANSLQVGAQLNIAVTVGGSGGNGGNAGTVFTALNFGQIVTMGSDSYGIQAQSIGGGGGNGGAAFSEAVQLFSASPSEIPSALVNVAVGGSGGTAGNGGNVIADNENAIITEGAQSYGIFAQSVGGGGGDGGDSSVVNIELTAPTVSATTAVGGSGGAGGQGGNVTANNSGLILSLGTGADGMLAQSVGGGGGNGGSAQADTGAFLSSDKTVQVTVTVGGSGGSGGDGGTVEANNLLGGIVTRGDGASGMFAQSVGGGGGTGNFSKALGSGGGTLNVNVAVGGGGGKGGKGGAVTADNQGAILTLGGSAPGIMAQSVGGGGGKGGDAASGAGTDPEVRAADYIAGGLGIGADVINDGNGIYTLKDNTHGDFDVLGKLTSIVTGYDTENDSKAPPAKEGEPEESPSFSVDVGAGFAGKGGSAGSGGKLTVTNEGSIHTAGADSDGILAQSIGGGGGDGGISNPAPSNNQLPAASAISAAIGVGGQGGSSGNGGEIDVTDAGSIATTGDLANGIHAQSIGAGGGAGGLTLAQNGVLGNLALAIGGDGGSNGDGGAVNVAVGAAPTSNPGTIVTSGSDASDILAQSIGGGGGLSSLLGTTVPDNSGGRGESNTSVINTTTLPGSSILNLKIDGATGSSGNGGPVSVTLNKSPNTIQAGYLVTAGVDSYAVLAQSIGGGGGLVTGVPDANARAMLDHLFSAGASKGNGGTVAVTVEHGFSIGTAGAGGVGILAQSIGGGGGLIGGLSNVNLVSPILPTPVAESGQGGDVTVDLESGANLATGGAGAHGIAAMSLGGGGGILDEADGDGFAFASNKPFNAPGAGFAPTGTVTINVDGNSFVRTTGPQAYSIYAASQGDGTNAVKINIGPGGYVESWAHSAGAILVNGAGGKTDNVITNAGTIDNGTNPAVPGNPSPNATGIAILGYVPVTINNTGTINGSTQVGNGSVFNNEVEGIFDAGSVIDVGPTGQLSNQGLLTIGSASTNVSVTQLTGNLSQSRTGTILVRLDALSNQADQLHVTGTAQLSGQIALQVIDPADLKPGSAEVNILTADGGVATSGLKAALAGSPILQYVPIRSSSNGLAVSYTVDFSDGGQLRRDGLGSGNQLAVGGAINAIQTAGGADGIDGLIASLTELRSAQALADLYDSLSGAATADAQQVLFGAQQAYQSTITQHVWNQAGLGRAPASETATGSGEPTEVWVGGLGSTDLLDGTDGQRSLHAQTAGALIGIDHSTDQGLTYGLSLGGGSSDFSVSQENSRGHDTAVNVAAYALARHGEIYLSGVLSYGNFSTDLHRYDIAGISGLLASGRETFDSNVAGGRIELGWTHGIGALTVTPYAAIDLDELWQGGFSEDVPGGGASANSGLALRYGSVSELSAPLTLGTRLSTSLLLGGTQRVTPYLDLGWVHEFNPKRSVDAAFLAAPEVSFKVTGVSASRNAALTSVGGTLSLTRRLSLLASFNGQFSSTETSYGGFGGLQLGW